MSSTRASRPAQTSVAMSSHCTPVSDGSTFSVSAKTSMRDRCDERVATVASVAGAAPRLLFQPRHKLD
eukprot:CAMPEP_0198349914 /NCGR_PEP_ID=MMETSP1450-20131203/96575_1 /TAXON_ID=753684 ORGANISM="Madagascaria erythrocladiodes, Strain CCMP3234" /NCGR_SAMPLE_ID=MMETSP1450 /ASSEMBLY_ACC=CAM_ASM_001115 /LENGTH=67 /DNA_ID=CAMNT_0044055655 /DNA_START=11 /DNA_END=211 /DNA_ORIENTATION=+